MWLCCVLNMQYIIWNKNRGWVTFGWINCNYYSLIGTYQEMNEEESCTLIIDATVTFHQDHPNDMSNKNGHLWIYDTSNEEMRPYYISLCYSICESVIPQWKKWGPITDPSFTPKKLKATDISKEWFLSYILVKLKALDWSVVIWSSVEDEADGRIIEIWN